MTPISPKRTVAGVLVLAAIAAPTAGASPAEQVQGSASSHSAPAAQRFVPYGPDAGVYCGKDYSRNSATGDYCVRLKATTSSPLQNVVKHDDFSWGDAGTGAGAALGLLIAVAGSTVVIRRRRAVSGGRRHRAPAAT
jgi:hypothetical protein